MADIVSFYEKEGLTQSFYAPSASYTVEGWSLTPGPHSRTFTKDFDCHLETLTPDTAIWVVDATDSDHGKASSNGLSSLLATGPLRPKEKLLVVINKT